MDLLHILHISDLHFSDRAASKQQLLIKPFLSRLKDIVKEGTRPGYVIFSGDLVNDPDEPNVYVKLIDFIDEVRVICGLSFNEIILCPGNHDVSRAALAADKSLYDEIQESRVDQTKMDNLYRSGKLSQHARVICGGFFDLAELCSGGWSDPFYSVRNFDNGLSVACFNTAVCCSLKGSAEDKGRLSILPTVIEQAVNEMSGDVRILVCHHGSEQFVEWSSREVGHLRESHFQFCLFGHVHDAIPVFVKGVAGAPLLVQAPALYDKREPHKGFFVLSMDLPYRHARVRGELYLDGQSRFVPHLAIGEHGVFFPGEEHRKFWSRYPSFDKETLRQWLRGRIESHLRELGEGFDERPLLDTFVYPPIAELTDPDQPDEDGAEQVGALWSATRICEAPENLAIFIPEEFGATTLLGFLAHELYNGNHPEPRIPLQLDIRPVKPYTASVMAALKAAHPESSDSTFGWQSMLTLQPYVILIDNFNWQDSAHVKIVSLIRSILPEARLIIAVRTSLSFHGGASPVTALEFPLRRLALQPLTRARIRELVHKWRLPSMYEEPFVVEEISTRFRALDIPLVGPHISLYLTILSGQKGYVPLNLSSILESFVEKLLDKNSISDFFRRNVDFREKVEVLSVVAEHMAREGVSEVTQDKLYELVRGHYVRVGIAREAAELVRNFNETRVFETEGGQVRFRYHVLLAFFTAYRIGLSAEFKEFILQEQRLGQFVYEIDIYCGLNRHDSILLDSVANLYSTVSTKLMESMSPFFNQAVLSTIRLPASEEAEEFVDAMEEELGRELSQDERDGSVQRRETAATFVQDFKRPDVQDLLVRWFLVLRAYTVCVKNLESIDRERKEQHLKVILEGWSAVVTMAVLLITAVMERNEIPIGGIRIQVKGGTGLLDAQSLRRLVVLVPGFVSSFLRADLGTGKLSLILAEGGDAEAPVSTFFRAGLLADLKAEGFLDHVGQFIGTTRASPFLKEAMMWKLREVYLRLGFTDVEGLQFRRAIATVGADLLGLQGEKRDKHIAMTMQRLQARKNVRQAKV